MDETSIRNPILSTANDRIIKDGFKIGGVSGHTITNGSSRVSLLSFNAQQQGNGIYCASGADTSSSYNYSIDRTGERRMIAVRARPGRIGSTAMYGAAATIGVDHYDSHVSSDTFVLRRPCQALPCMIVYY